MSQIESGTSKSNMKCMIYKNQNHYPNPLLNDLDIPNDEGAYYYKHSLFWGSRAASVILNFSKVQLKHSTLKDPLEPTGKLYKNNGYAFLSCLGRSASPPEFGIYTVPEFNGEWYLYTRTAGVKTITKRERVIVPSSSSNGIYTYSTSASVSLKINLSGSNIAGAATWNDGTGSTGYGSANYTVNGVSAGIGETAEANTFLFGASFAPDTKTKTPSNRGAFFRNLNVTNSKLYETKTFGNPSLFIPGYGTAGPQTYYGIIVDYPCVTYSYNGGAMNADSETISINY